MGCCLQDAFSVDRLCAKPGARRRSVRGAARAARAAGPGGRSSIAAGECLLCAQQESAFYGASVDSLTATNKS